MILHIHINKFICTLYSIIACATIVKAQTIVTHSFSATDTLNHHYGVCAHITRPQVDYIYRNRDMQTMDSVGISWVRTDFDFRTMWRLNNNYNTAIFDSVMISTQQANKYVLGILDRKAISYAWDDWDNYEQYATFIVNRYRNQIGAWEMMNEADWIKNVDSLSSKYILTAKQLYTSIKQTDPNATVLMSGVANPKGTFFDDLLSSGTYQYCDAMNIHSYAAPESNLKILTSVAERMNKYGCDKPLWITECGMHTVSDGEFNFYKNVLPVALAKIGITASDVPCCIISDAKHSFLSITTDEEERYIKPMFLSVEKIGLDDLKTLNADEYPILIASDTEIFPITYFDSLYSYVENGGTIILPFGMPLYYDVAVSGKDKGQRKQMGSTYANKLHISTLTWWSDEGKRLSIPEKATWIKGTDSTNIDKHSDGFQVRFLDGRNMQPGDKLIPLVQAGDDKYTGIVTAIYNLNSNLKGNIIINSRMDELHYIDKEKEQARRIARNHIIAFSCGVEKVFTYNLRSFENNLSNSEDNYGITHRDLSPKPAYYAYKTLTQMLPNGSTRPQLWYDNNVYAASWHNGHKYVIAIWTIGHIEGIRINIANAYIYNYMGESIETPNATISDGVIFILSDSQIQLETDSDGNRIISQ